MALVVNDRVKETSTTTGTGTFSLAGASLGFETFVAGIGNTNTTYYAIVNENGEFEVGLGTVTDAATDTLSRDTIISSSNSDSAVNFSAGTKDVFCTSPASKSVILDASGNIVANNASNLTALNATQLTSGTVPNARLDAQLQDVAGLAVTNGNFIVGDGSNFVAESGSTARDSLGLGTSNDVQFDSFGVGTAASGTTGEIRATNDVTAFYSSDRKLKENVKNIENPIEKIQKINGVTFDWTDEYIKKHGGEDNYFVRKKDVGVIAQEIEEVLPEVVATRKDGTKAVKYDRICALLIESIKELKKEIEELKSGA